MPIIDIQRRLREVGRIRIGEQVPTKNGGTRPSKLDRFRFTSADEYSINLVAKVYGGDVRPWEGASVGTQWELFTESVSLDVIVPPVELAFSQYMELWSGGGCQRRCDRQTNLITDKPCCCDPDTPDCKPTTRLGVILTGIDGIGVWRLESHGWAAATELNGAVEVLRVVQNRGAMVPARLLLEQRQQKKINQETGKPETFNFPVPVLDLNLSVAALTGVSAPQMEQAVTPIDASRQALPSIAEQAKAIETLVEKPKRSNAAATLPPTGIKPRTADDRTEGGASLRSMRRLMAIIKGNKEIPDDDEGRHAWARLALDLPDDAPVSFSQLSQSDINKLNNVADGSEPLVSVDAVSYADDDPERPF